VKAAYPAGLGRRLGALLYDWLLVIALWMMTLFIWIATSDGEAVTGWPVQAVLATELIAFYVISWRRQGQTLGMTAWHIRVVDPEGQLPSLKQILLRLAVAPVSLFAFATGYLWLYVDSEQRTWHDRASGTLVVHVPKVKKTQLNVP
jgi:uncharacterized RDD family membrane protein YckC